MELSIIYVASISPASIPKLKRYTSTTLIIHQAAASPLTPSHFPMAAPSAASVGDLAMVPSSYLWPAGTPRETLVLEEFAPKALEASLP
jgi:hypothetical protein